MHPAGENADPLDYVTGLRYRRSRCSAPWPRQRAQWLDHPLNELYFVGSLSSPAAEREMAINADICAIARLLHKRLDAGLSSVHTEHMVREGPDCPTLRTNGGTSKPRR